LKNASIVLKRNFSNLIIVVILMFVFFFLDRCDRLSLFLIEADAIVSCLMVDCYYLSMVPEYCIVIIYLSLTVQPFEMFVRNTEYKFDNSPKLQFQLKVQDVLSKN
jgi:hypothetical protein